MGLRVGYFAGETVANLRRNLLLTMAAISTVAISLFLLGGAMILGQIVERVVGRWEGMVEVSVFLKDENTPEQTRELATAISGMPEVARHWYVTKEEAFKEYQEMFKDSPEVYENVDPMALPASFRIKLHDPKTVEVVGARLVGQPGVGEVKFGEDYVRKLLRINALLRTMSVVMTVILLGASILLIANTIRLAIYARRREIGIMKLVGATNWFIRVPFLFEGMTEAALGALTAAGIIYATKALLLDRLQAQMPFLPLTVGVDAVLRLFLVLLAIGMGIGALGSTLALRRFMRV
ncbi:MAG: permease-like cell division protein FtsX [Actinomycetota bacterium]